VRPSKKPTKFLEGMVDLEEALGCHKLFFLRLEKRELETLALLNLLKRIFINFSLQIKFLYFALILYKDSVGTRILIFEVRVG